MPTPSLLLIHGAASGAWIWDNWRRELGALGWQVNVLDLRGHGRSMPIDLSMVTMEDYLADVASVTSQIEAAQGVHPIIGGWSLGGMVAMMYAAQHPQTPAMLLFDPMLPLELGKADMDTVRRFSGDILTPATFGIYASDAQRSRKVLFDLSDEELNDFLARSEGAEESGVAFRQTLRGISVPPGAITSPTMIVSPAVTGTDLDTNRQLAAHLSGSIVSVPDTGHWGIVWHTPAVAKAALEVDRWLRGVVNPADEPAGKQGDS